MIGSDEFNFRNQSARSTISGADELDYIETSLTTSGNTRRQSRLLIDIVCPQPQSKQRSSTPKASGQSTIRTARTNSTNGWKK